MFVRIEKHRFKGIEKHMPKDSTKLIQEFIFELGTSLGFTSHMEYSFFSKNDTYTPIYDVVWLMDVTQNFDTSPIKQYVNSESWHPLLDQVVVAAFEIEGSTTTSKNQVGNVANLYLSPSYFKFVIVNNAGACNENDTYRRGVKIARTFEKVWGVNNLFFLDWEHIKDFNISYNNTSNNISSNTDSSYTPDKISRSKVGGESRSVAISEIILENLAKSRFQVKENYSPESIKHLYTSVERYQRIPCPEEYDYLLGRKFVCDPTTKESKPVKKSQDYFYTPKIDIALGFNLPSRLNLFFKWISETIGEEHVNNSFLTHFKYNQDEQLFFPYLGCEVESSVNKHLNGGVMNCSRFFYTGLLVAPKGAERHLNTLKERLGIFNIFFYPHNFT
jgi:hypothetical protein